MMYLTCLCLINRCLFFVFNSWFISYLFNISFCNDFKICIYDIVGLFLTYACILASVCYISVLCILKIMRGCKLNDHINFLEMDLRSFRSLLLESKNMYVYYCIMFISCIISLNKNKGYCYYNFYKSGGFFFSLQDSDVRYLGECET